VIAEHVEEFLTCYDWGVGGDVDPSDTMGGKELDGPVEVRRIHFRRHLLDVTRGARVKSEGDIISNGISLAVDPDFVLVRNATVEVVRRKVAAGEGLGVGIVTMGGENVETGGTLRLEASNHSSRAGEASAAGERTAGDGGSVVVKLNIVRVVQIAHILP
jgi:hypothetical protein